MNETKVSLAIEIDEPIRSVNVRRSRCKLFKILLIGVTAVCIVECIYLTNGNDDESNQTRQIMAELESPRTIAAYLKIPVGDSLDEERKKPQISAKVAGLHRLHIDDGFKTFRDMSLDIWGHIQEFHARGRFWFLTDLQMEIMKSVVNGVENHLKTQQCDCEEILVDYKQNKDYTAIVQSNQKNRLDIIKRIPGQVTEAEMDCLNQTIYQYYGGKMSIERNWCRRVISYDFDGNGSYLSERKDYCRAQKKVPLKSRKKNKLKKKSLKEAEGESEDMIIGTNPQSQLASFETKEEPETQSQCSCDVQ